MIDFLFHNMHLDFHLHAFDLIAQLDPDQFDDCFGSIFSTESRALSCASQHSKTNS